jgi:hypothetical protein
MLSIVWVIYGGATYKKQVKNVWVAFVLTIPLILRGEEDKLRRRTVPMCQQRNVKGN